MMNKAIYTFSLALAILGGTYMYQQSIQTPEVDCNFVQNKSKQRVSWGKNFPIEFRIHESVPYEAIDSIRQAAHTWNTISKMDLIHIIDTNSDVPFSMYDKVNGIYWKKAWSKNHAKEQARTTIRWKKETAISADVLVNNKNFKFFFSDEESSMDKVDFLGMMVHEFGHALGLAHVPNHHLSVMYPVLPKGFERRSNNNHNILHDVDLKSFQCEYASIFKGFDEFSFSDMAESEDDQEYINSSSHSP